MAEESTRLTRRDRASGVLVNVTIDVLPEEVLLDIFDFHLCLCKVYIELEMEWKTRVQVCRRWRFIVFSSSLRLNLRAVCTGRTPVRKMLGIWPALPIVVQFYRINNEVEVRSMLSPLLNTGTASEINVYGVSDHELKPLAEATQQGPFHALKDLYIKSFQVGRIPIVPDSLLGGSVPGLRSLFLKGVEFPALGKLLLSVTGLVNLSLCANDSAIINHKTMADWSPSLTRLVKRQIEYRYVHLPQARPSSRLPPLARIVLPVLTTFALTGGSEYLDPLFSHFDTPRLKHVDMDFVHPPTFAFSKISRFIGCMESFEASDQAHMLCLDCCEVVSVWLSSQKGTTGGGMWPKPSMSWEPDFWQLEPLAQVHHPFAQPLATPERFAFLPPRDGQMLYWVTKTGNDQRVEFLRFSSAVGNLYLSKSIARFVAPVLQKLGAGESATKARDVFPALQTISVEGLDVSEYEPVREAIGKFVVVARKLPNHPVAVYCWVEN